MNAVAADLALMVLGAVGLASAIYWGSALVRIRRNLRELPTATDGLALPLPSPPPRISTAA